MVRAGPSPHPVVLPKVQFERVQDEVSAGGPPGVQDGQARSFGYNDGYPYIRPELYIRHIEPLEIDLARQVEYDMDEQDEEWLEAVNIERKKEHMDRVSAETFEIIMDRLEKEWFDLTKNLPKSDLAMPSEDSTCAVCDDSEGENSNAIVFCDGCNLAVHQDCYGVPYIPEGQWLCRKCTVSPENPVQCYLCPNEGGAFKQTIHGDWVHLLCAIWVPETRVANDVFMEPITGVEKISKQRWKLRCSICDVRQGACIQCAKSSCFVAFHATCARQEKLLLPMKTTHGAETATLQAFCERHLPKEQQDIRAAALAAEEGQADNKHSSKAARAYNKTYKPGPPIVPAIIVNRISQYIHRIKIRKKVELVQLICRYWSLKREARRGAPLLKRLHLEPWTAGGGKIQTVEEKRMKLEQLQSLRRDLTYVKMLTLLIKFRELRKLKQTEIIHQVLSLALYPHESALRMALETIMGADKLDFFKHPVNKNDVPDYFDIVLNPMCWSMIEDRLDKHEYWDVKTFRGDIDLVINNALLYNQPGTPFYKAALRIRSVSQPILANLERLALPPSALPPLPEGEEDASALPAIGDLESPLDILELLISGDAIREGLNLEFDADPITSLLNTEAARYKPPPPPSPIIPAPPPRSKKSSKKRDRRAEAERARARKAAARTASASQTPAEARPEEGMEMKVEAADVEGRMLDLREPRTRASPPKRRKQPSMSLPPSVIPRVVDDVDNQGSFQYFNSGWILPPDHKRHGRAPVDKAVLPPPKKKQKTDHNRSRRPSTTSLAPSEAQNLVSSPAEDTHPQEAFSEPGPSRMEIDPFSVKPGQAFPPGTSFDETNPQRMSVDPSGRVVVETLDTPLTRRQKSMKKKAERKKAPTSTAESIKMDEDGHPPESAVVTPESTPAPAPAADQEAELMLEPVPKSKRAGPPSLAPVQLRHRKLSVEEPVDEDSESELSELSDLPSEEADAPTEEQPARKKPTEARRGKAKRVAESYDSGTLGASFLYVSSPYTYGNRNLYTVWAKADSYPWWPAVIFDADHPDVPTKVLNGYKELRLRRKIKLYIVRFYDRNQSWQFLARDKLQLLGEDAKLDADMLAPHSINQKWKSSSIRQTCRDAYRVACNEMETKSDEDEVGQTVPEAVTEQSQ
ncbi:bromodomain and PHD finger-containing protein 3 [Ephemerocybe angulata]|uniref:Bromodomain and PHD finger-containing protein 3 n=1 Tax=Ephemerocybe angulata TaxID=980116 RepID=A0A8H6HX34_9AGAR|nr:bromodomain and PHD finger-containing protein 3 [Tulosesus angulatus]